MRLSEAYDILSLPQTANLEDCKQRYKLLAKQYHPDLNKDPSASDRMKEINEAYQCIQNGKGNEREASQPHNPWGGFHRQQTIQLEHIQVNLTIDFKESVLGCKKEIKYARTSKCAACDGHGQVKLDNGCLECKGRGQITKQHHGMIMVSTCPKCHGKSNLANCSTCQGEGTTHADTSVQVSVPAGILDGNTLRLQNMGNYAGSIMGIMEQHTDVLCTITVIPEVGLSIEGKSVITTLPISLLDAIKGCHRQVKTIFGEREIIIPPASRNKEEVIVPRCGVSGTGDQRVILDVQYPANIDKLVNSLIEET
jgi:molecular chaperone DnaJ